MTNFAPDTKIKSPQKSFVVFAKAGWVPTTHYHDRNGRFSGVRVLIFDLDGTLIDSKEDLVLSVNATLEHMGHAELPHDVVCSYIGRGAAALIRSSLGPAVTDQQAEEGHEFFLSYYRRHMLDQHRHVSGRSRSARRALYIQNGRADEQAGALQSGHP